MVAVFETQVSVVVVVLETLETRVGGGVGTSGDLGVGDGCVGNSGDI